ncbi:MAG: DUF302 domain-containing protein [Actinomycetota bacterium]
MWLARPFDETVAAVREALAAEGFGVLTEIDVRATLEAKLGVTVQQQVILGACNPPLAHAALEAEPSLGLLLPCNVVVRAGDGGTIVEAIDPRMLVTVSGNEALTPIAGQVADKLDRAIATLA